MNRTLQCMAVKDNSDASVLHTIPVSCQQQVSPCSTSCMVAKSLELMYGSPNQQQVKQSRYSAQLKQSLDAYTQVRESAI